MSTGVIPFIRMRMQQNELLHVRIRMFLLDGKSLHTQGTEQHTQTQRGKNYTGPIIAFTICIRIKHKWNLSFRMHLNTILGHALPLWSSHSWWLYNGAGQHYKVTMSVTCHKCMHILTTLAVART